MVTHFASRSPALHVAAHEAAHQLQHAGVTTDGGMGAERHAHEVARAVMSGGSARHLLGSQGARVAPSIRHFTDLKTADQTATNQWKFGSDEGPFLGAWGHEGHFRSLTEIARFSGKKVRVVGTFRREMPPHPSDPPDAASLGGSCIQSIESIEPAE